MLLTGKFDHSIDAKHRLAIPAEIRSRLESADDAKAMYITTGANGALWLWPERTFEALAGDIEPSLLPDPELMDFDELTFPEARRLEFDKVGRLRIPEEMLKDAELGSRVMILGVRNHLELRDPTEWEHRIAERAARRTEIVRGARPVVEQKTRQTKRGGEAGS